MSKHSTNKAKQPTNPKVRSRTLQKTKRNTKYGYSPKTIRETLRICRDKGILAEYIKKMEGEIMDIMTYMFDEENNKRLFGLEQWRLGEKKE